MNLLDVLKKINNLKKNSYSNKIKIAIFRDITAEKIIPYLEYFCLKNQLKPIFFISKYSSIFDEIDNNSSKFYKFNPNIIIIYNSLSFYEKDIYENFFEYYKNYKIKNKNIYKIINYILQKVSSLKNVKVLFNNFILPEYPAMALLDYQSNNFQINSIRSINYELNKIINLYHNVHLVDLDYLTNKIGLSNSLNNQSWYYEKNPYSEMFLQYLSLEYTKFFNSFSNKNKKCLILDLDNTLWGGILGEDGINGIIIGNEFPGNIYRDFQKAILNLYNRGVILAISSKNNLSDVMDVFNNKEEMILNENHFSAFEINWNDKASNIKKIADELNISLDHIVFIDDSAFETGLVKNLLPTVEVIQLPKDPIEIVNYFNFNNFFNNLDFTAEDRKRNKLYKEDKLRKEFKTNYFNINEYLKSLNMEIQFYLNDKNYAERISQLTKRTNQFNLTLRKYDLNQINDMILDDKFDVISFRLSDRFGDQGVVSSIIINYEKNTAIIECFVLSCRAFGRKLEKAILNLVIKHLSNKKIYKIKSEFVLSEKKL